MLTTLCCRQGAALAHGFPVGNEHGCANLRICANVTVGEICDKGGYILMYASKLSSMQHVLVFSICALFAWGLYLMTPLAGASSAFAAESELAAGASPSTVMTAQSAKVSTKNSPMVGKWILIKGSDKNLSASKIKRLKSYGYVATLKLKKNGKIVLNAFGKMARYNWVAKSKTKAYIIESGQDEKLLLKKGKLKLISGSGNWSLFKRM